MKQQRPRCARRGGFTLLELIIVMSLLALMAGALTPAVSAILRSGSTRETNAELELLRDAVTDYYRDVRAFPADLLDLQADSATGWSGPYVIGTVDDPWSGQSGYTIDGFGNAYRLSTSGYELTLTSDGPDRAAGGGDDISVVINVTPLLRELTLEELARINAAVTQYNSVYLSSSPLPGTWAGARSMLESSGYLPIGGGYDTDEWGSAYQGDPVGVAPMMRVVSVNVGS